MNAVRRQGGFTLVEVVLAVAILALAMVALSQTIGASARAYLNIDGTRRAHSVAADKLVELQVYARWPSVGITDDTVTRGDREWWVRTEISAGPYPDTRRVDIDVGRIKDDQHQRLMYSMASLIGKPASGKGQGRNNSRPGPQPVNQDVTGG